MHVVPKPRSQAAFSPRGDLQTTPFAELLVTLLDLRVSGMMRLIDPRGDAFATVFFERGVPIAARTQSAGATLAQSLIPLCACADGEYLFLETRDHHDIDNSAITGRVDPVALINAAMRGPVREDRVQQVLDVIGDREVRVHPRTNLERYQLTPNERDLATEIAEAPTTVAELLSRPGANERLVRRMFYVLHVTRALSPVPGQRNVSGTINRVLPPSAAPPADGDATPRPESGGRYHVRHDEGVATDVVSTGRKRSIPPAAQARRERELEAEELRRETERQLRASDYPAALSAAHRAVRAYDSARNEALFAWVLFLGGGDAERVQPRVLRHLEAALMREPDCIDAHYYKGLVHKRRGEHDMAFAHWRRVIRLKPDHEGASRELRVLDMRARSQSTSGFIAKIFKKSRSS